MRPYYYVIVDGMSGTTGFEASDTATRFARRWSQYGEAEVFNPKGFLVAVFRKRDREDWEI